ncbi:hypothetical protein NHU_01892 [Rhodovulum sulfidophilum]|uniref:Uncharacterized protein n=1 Tax=Rhodovulum sulfidophilum TaxID=35806 RepID=A0A0D6B1R5_RHOSU|nr:hypothetical protein NHU_01892 [Rhodovulum sulfidophilum]
MADGREAVNRGARHGPAASPKDVAAARFVRPLPACAAPRLFGRVAGPGPLLPRYGAVNAAAGLTRPVPKASMQANQIAAPPPNAPAP